MAVAPRVIPRPRLRGSKKQRRLRISETLSVFFEGLTLGGAIGRKTA
jgi:hypothetical protein